MAQDIFLKFDSPVTGESQDSTYKGQIDILSWSFGVSNPTHVIGTGLSTGRADFSDLSLTKHLDKSSPTLLKACANGTSYNSATLICRKSGKDKLEFLTIKLSNAFISSYSISDSSGGSEHPVENIGLTYEKIDYSYTPQKDDGTGDAAIDVKWSVTQNTDSF